MVAIIKDCRKTYIDNVSLCLKLFLQKVETPPSSWVYPQIMCKKKVELQLTYSICISRKKTSPINVFLILVHFFLVWRLKRTSITTHIKYKTVVRHITIFLSLPHSLLHLMDMASNSDIQLALCTMYTFGSDILIAPTRCTELVRICNTTWTKSRLAIIVLCYFILKKIMHSLLYTPFLIIWTLIVAIIVSSYNPPPFFSSG